MKKKIIYVDMDNTLADYIGYANECNLNVKDAKHIRGFFRSLPPMPGAIEAFNKLSEYFDVYILTTVPWSNPLAFAEKIAWVKEWLPNCYKNVIASHHKDLNNGDYLIDDSEKNGAGDFHGVHIPIHSDKFKNWDDVIKFIFEREKIN
jgi:5'(3')-deoxyribonucleotidase